MVTNLYAVHHFTEGDSQDTTNRYKTKMRLTLSLVTAIIAVTVSYNTSAASPRVEEDSVVEVQHSMKVLIHKINSE